VLVNEGRTAVSGIAQTVRRLADDPYAATSRTWATATVVDGPAVVTSADFAWTTDLPSSIGGTAAAPSPVHFFLGSIAGCSAAVIKHTLAPEFGVEIDRVSATIRCTSDQARLLGLGTRPALTDITIDITIESGSSAERVAAMQRAWLDRCPLYLALTAPTDIGVTFQHTSIETFGGLTP
jgi:uncharacterized OsmC-like protein